MAFGLVMTPACAVAQSCRLALVLALDVSSSVDGAEYVLQRDGVAAALVQEDVVGAILGGGDVHLAVYEWSGRRKSRMVLDWVALTDRAAIERAAARIARAERSFAEFPTAMGYALGYGAGVLRRGPGCARQVIDLSGDGVTNDGFAPRLAYEHFPFGNVTVNGLAVLGADPDVVGYFEREVAFGPGAFVETAQGYVGYRRAMERKLFREIESRVVGQTHLGAVRDR